ncbi:hypothetical protein [Paenibacillus wynnii]|uniref:Uncharacterized protein n=1 Tax=Paenibacillus wynnii TaxID=268407 RepID=A0A098M4E9_9BACL|nr:hypothetical protein [Paenibacillus wynnii]KGE16898.1 hypothetical protein PWYN_19675 [Paenibacillus wynnii]
MLRLVKYDLRRNRDQIWIAFVVLILAQLGIWISAGVSNWGNEPMLILYITSYSILGTILTVQACRTFNYNLKSYHRRLLPLKSVSTVLSPLLMYLILLLGVSALAAIHFGLYMVLAPDVIPIHTWIVPVVGLLQLLWTACFVFIFLMLGITVARSLRFKGRVWIGIAVFLLVLNGFSLMENWLIGEDNNSFVNALQFQMTDQGTVSEGGITVSIDVYTFSSILVEVSFALIIIYIITQLMNRRVES